MLRRTLTFAFALVLSACSPEPQPANPAFWELTGPDGEKGWLFGTIHSLERPADWESAEISTALAESGVVMVEVADLGDRAAMNRTFAKLATSEGLPPLMQRVDPLLRDRLNAVLDANGLDPARLQTTETWAVALIIAQAEAADLESEYGIDRAVIRAAGDKPVAELEGAAPQLRLFDTLPEKEQRDLLEAIVRDARSLGGESPEIAVAWRKGDMQTITRESERGLLADPELREVLFTGRNAKWAERIARDIAEGHKPFVAVGAAHMAGPDGLPAMLGRRGLTVARIQ